MFALIRIADNALDSIVESTNGYDLSLYTAVPFTGDPMAKVWDGTRMVPRPPTPAGETAAALEADPRWRALRGAPPQQVENWLAANVTDIASARQVLKLLVLVVQRLARTR